LLLWLLASSAVADSSTPARQLSEQRRAYTAAMQAINAGDAAQYARLRAGLDDYPLAIYLDYFQLSRQAGTVSPAAARQFLDRSADSPLANRFLAMYLREAGKAQRWTAFLQAMPGEPNSPDLKCYFFRAQLAQGNREAAWSGARRLWEEGKSQPPACDPLFEAWQRDGKLTDEIVWTRLLNVFDTREEGLLQYVAKKSSAALRPWADRLLAVYAEPPSVASLALDPGSPYSADIAGRALAHLASSNPQLALTYWLTLQQQLNFNMQQTQYVEHAVALQNLFARDAAQSEWLHGALARLKDDKLVGIRLRWALREQDWAALERTMPLLSESARNENVWRYWQAIVQERRGETDAAHAVLAQLAVERDYYGFLAADRLGQPYALNHQRLLPSDLPAVEQLPVVARIEELHFHGEYLQAQSEWYKLLQDTTERTQQQDLALLATQKGWYRMAIDAATRAQAWDALDQRFPTAFRDVFSKEAAAWRVPGTELMAIARRESAFFPEAQSPVGARGLMQIMPATGEVVAASLKQRHSEADLLNVEHNVLLGSAYYRQLLDRFGGNRPFALAAYNAGPHRVDRWRNKQGQGMPVEFWVETIPYQETRNYVQAVLSYNVVFQYMQGDTQVLLTPQERQGSY
jgi:soluble lytic murein transglycosylase